MPSPTDDESETPFPALNLTSTVFSSHLSPDDAYTTATASASTPHVASHGFGTEGAASSVRVRSRSRSHLRRINSDIVTGAGGGGGGSSGRRRRRGWKKLMWVKQSYPDNYTDRATFLENLQRNPRLKPYDFWPLVADSTVILQHVCSVIIFIACFAGIFQNHLSPVSVVSWSSFGTFLGWLLWELWIAEDADEDGSPKPGTSAAATLLSSGAGGGAVGGLNTLSRRRTRAASIRRPLPPPPPSLLNVGRQAEAASIIPSVPSAPPSTAPSTRPPSGETSAESSTTNLTRPPLTPLPTQSATPPPPPPPTITTTAPSSSANTSTPSLPRRSSQEGLADADIINDENRNHTRLSTIKSAILIYCTLLGLSPILKSLTKSTSPDSIWAMSFWLLTLNIFFFDYSGGVGVKFPASLSTNAALMASTVLASRLPSTGQVFSLTLFSIEVFGLFPIFRRHVKHRSWRYHVMLTAALVLGAGFGVGTLVGKKAYPGRALACGAVGMVVSVIISVVATGGCSWWLIGLQKYKNEIRGPWDQARPVIMSRPRWD